MNYSCFVGLIIFCQKYRSLKVIVKRQFSENPLDLENGRDIIHYMKEKMRESELFSLDDNSRESFENVTSTIPVNKDTLNRENQIELSSLDDTSRDSFEIVADTVSVIKDYPTKSIKQSKLSALQDTLNNLDSMTRRISIKDRARMCSSIPLEPSIRHRARISSSIPLERSRRTLPTCNDYMCCGLCNTVFLCIKAVTVAINSGIYFSDSALVETRPVKLIDKILSEKDCLTITGVSGSGKTVILYQLADKMFQQEGYQIVTANNPSDVLAKNDDYLKQLFVFDDVCGKFSFDPILADNWNLRSAKIRKILKENRTKIIFSCRANISKELMFQSVSILADNICDIQSSEFSMTTEDNFKIAASHNLHEIDLGRLKTTNDFKSNKCIPLFCNLYNVLRTDDTNVLHFFSHCKEILEDKMRLIANNPMCSTIFFFFVIYNNKLGKSFAKDYQSIMNEIGERLFQADEVIDAVQRCRLFVKKNNDSFFICHDMVFDILVSFVSQRRLDDVLKCACLDILCERCHFESIGIGPEYGCIKIPFHKEELYFKSVFRNVVNIKSFMFFKNRQLKFKSYRTKFITFLFNNVNEQFFTESIYRTDVSPLLISTFQGLHDVVGVLLKKAPSNVVNIADEVGRTALYIAAEFNDIHTGKILLSYRCDSDISRRDEYHKGESPLHIAAFKCNYEFIQLLIENNVQINQRNAMHMTALHISCTKEDVPSVQLLLRNGAKTNIPDTKMNIPLHTAIDKGNNTMVESLIYYRSNLQTINEDGVSPLYLAASKGHVVIVGMLLKAKLDIANVHVTYMSPLYVAAKEGLYETVKLLLDAGAKPDSCSLLDKSPLYVALEMSHVKIAKYLLEKNANPNLFTYGGFTPLYVSSLKGYTEVVDILLRKKADPNICTSEKLSPLYVACLKGHFEIVKMLWNSGADMYLSDLNCRTPLYVASREGHFEIVKFILDNGADPNKTNVANRTPLFIAALEGHLDIVRYLLHKNADLHIATVDRETPLIVASREGHVDIIKLLLHNGAGHNSK